MSEMSSDIIRNNSVNGAGTLREGPSPGRCPLGKQRRPSRHQKTARTWSNVGVTLSNLLHIFFQSCSANTKNINVATLKIKVIYKSTVFLAPRHIQFTRHYFDFESKKNGTRTSLDQTIRQR